jgi:GT2 family glycosyltransferase
LRVSVIIPYHNAAATLPLCLAALATQQPGFDFEIVCVDNNSTDDSATVVTRFAQEHPELTVVSVAEASPGPAAARNRGLQTARGQVLCFTDSDCIPSSTWLGELVGHLDDQPDLGAVSGCIRPYPSEQTAQKFTSLFTLPPHRHDRVHTEYGLVTGGFQTANLAVPREVLDRVGTFDARLRVAEDHDLCRRIYAQGLKILAAHDAVVRHWHRASAGGMLRQAFGYGRSHGYALRHFVAGACLVALPWAGMHGGLRPGWRVWLDLGQADKKLLLLLVAGCCWLPLLVLVPVYLLRLWAMIRARGRDLGVTVTVAEAWVMVALLLAKSAALTAGRVSGAWSNRVLCA